MSKRNLERLRVLIVDDNHHMINIVKTILRGFGIKDYYEARDAVEAFDLVRSESIDFVIVDYQMEILDGTDFVRLVRNAEDSPNPYIPVVMLTAYSERSKVEQARDAGVTEFCCKPVTAMELYRKVASVINTPRPFVRTAQYFGPDRRRHDSETYRGPERRKQENMPDSIDEIAAE
ncbi:MAG: two-component system response regulator [Hirschia sp.]|nr:two-component system response regulator [Hirschia sp.]MBF19304.1 two-component system response regulator [Hirschia sp.]|tara:strand:- start:251 stop:778 length:528 start_codon:yes stop_codon:yes gene_type:complete